MMRKTLALICACAALTAAAQPKNKAPKMAPVLAEGYYVGSKGDTVRGQVRTNPDDETELFRQFEFQPAKGGKVMPVSPKKAKAYGFAGRDFVQIDRNGEAVYVERLASGRLNLFKYRFNGKVDGYPGIETEYYAQDTRAEGALAGLKEVKKISTKFYKKDLKDYMKDQPMIWSDLDKFTFDEPKVVGSINEFNKYYTITAD